MIYESQKSSLLSTRFQKYICASVLVIIVFTISRKPLVLLSKLFPSDRWENSLRLTVTHSLLHKHKTRRTKSTLALLSALIIFFYLFFCVIFKANIQNRLRGRWKGERQRGYIPQPLQHPTSLCNKPESLFLSVISPLAQPAVWYVL